MDRERKLAALRRCLRSEGRGTGDERSFFCWLPKPDGCGGEHHKAKLAVNIQSDCWHCWVCGSGGRNLLRLLALGGKDHPDYLDYAAEIARDGEPKPAIKTYDPVALPPHFRPLCVPSPSLRWRQATGYLEARGLTADDILTYKLGYCEGGPCQDRVVVPSFDEHGGLNFWTARAIWRGTLPYLSGRFDKDIVFNDLLVDWSEPITLVEGPFDAIRAGTNAIPLQGKSLRPRLLAKILERRPAVRVALDGTPDALEPALKIAAQLMELGIEVGYVDLGGRKDPGEMRPEEIEERVARAVPVRDRLDLVRLRLLATGARA